MKERIPDLDKNMIRTRMEDLMIDCHLATINVLDPRKRLGHKFEIIGFDFLLDEDFRVWLIEVNTCPYLGPVLCAYRDNFMLDLLNDSFKLTIDKFFLNKDMTVDEIHRETEFELLVTADGKVNKRTPINCEDPSDDSPGKSRKLGWFPEFLYPSKIVHQNMLEN